MGGGLKSRKRALKVFSTHLMGVPTTNFEETGHGLRARFQLSQGFYSWNGAGHVLVATTRL
jgi:hypothetical protein